MQVKKKKIPLAFTQGPGQGILEHVTAQLPALLTDHCSSFLRLDTTSETVLTQHPWQPVVTDYFGLQ